MLFKYTEWPKLLKYAEWPYRFILGILFGSRLMAAGPARPLGPEGAPPGPGPGPALPRAPGAGPGRQPSAERRIECQE